MLILPEVSFDSRQDEPPMLRCRRCEESYYETQHDRGYCEDCDNRNDMRELG